MGGRHDHTERVRDTAPRRTLATRDGNLVRIDFEEACRGPVEWDLATTMDSGAVAAHHRPHSR
jgi:thiamine kinase-like enzyme